MKHTFFPTHGWKSTINRYLPEIHLPGHPTCLLVYFWAKPSSFCHLPRDLNGRGLGRGAIGWVDGMDWNDPKGHSDMTSYINFQPKQDVVFDFWRTKIEESMGIYGFLLGSDFFFETHRWILREAHPWSVPKNKQTNKQTNKHLPSSKSGSCR